ncbi:MAG: hypothetical protein AAB436_03335 [Patescibacteria group bacterium]
MTMTLTKQDLQAIKSIVDESVDESKIQTAAGFAELHDKFDYLEAEVSEVKQIVQRTERVLLNEVDRNNQQDKALLKIRNTLRAV